MEMLLPVWPLKWLLGRSEAETAGKFASRVETVKGTNSVQSALCWKDPSSAQTHSVVSPSTVPLLASLCFLGSSQDVLLGPVLAKALRVGFPV